MLFSNTGGQTRWTPLTVNTRCSRWTLALELPATVVLYLLVVADAGHVRSVLKLASHTDQKYLTVSNLPRIRTVV